MSSTFAELGIPFPLYESFVDGTEFAGIGTCCICLTRNSPSFRLGVGADVIIPCESCSTENGLDVDDKASKGCRNCGARVPFPEGIALRKEPKTCYSCLRAGKAALSKDTEFGLITWEHAVLGVTHGVPGLNTEEFETVLTFEEEEENWYGVRLPRESMLELLRTPTYSTWQGEHWLFCCCYPMTFVGNWDHQEFDRRAPDGNGERLYYSVVESVPSDSWDGLSNALSVYVFQCKSCGKLRAHYDFD